ncbi:hypothetical protein SAMN05443287_10211 [Micromonospora phaseoli]|uniref:Uncharacterized protein n=1 Tax=Micromonospora phaseoli TaxID=1144548 RepID=A0A1H6TWQ7_9ACTN|nr:hypothetical protein [Micromonospora phaseoli]PZV98777.1 hypothetical protein CLV64_10412 [Micromonospora phaseoli]GIJ76473.1 hypothetical protein Xph01_09050 [Micromonospora phaseoli]SEI84441.1 hypothetical protein SAMN05443287_10211 [Micromonospora phaseoli]
MKGTDLADSLIAGAVGTTALNIVTYLDMTARARPASQTPDESAGKLAGAAHLNLGSKEQAANRRSGLGALLGYGLGMAATVGFAMLARGRRQPLLRAAALLGGGVMTMTDGSLALLGVADPRTWRRIDWVADLVPHLAYGLTAAATWNRLRPSGTTRH